MDTKYTETTQDTSTQKITATAKLIDERVEDALCELYHEACMIDAKIEALEDLKQINPGEPVGGDDIKQCDNIPDSISQDDVCNECKSSALDWLNDNELSLLPPGEIEDGLWFVMDDGDVVGVGETAVTAIQDAMEDAAIAVNVL